MTLKQDTNLAPQAEIAGGQAKNASTRFFVLDLLRGLAALWVFTFHHPFSEAFQAKFPWLASFFQWGLLGVPMFFVISGYCITASARSVIRRDKSATDFIRRRIKRIYPPYWCSIAVVVALPFLMEFLSYLKTGSYVSPASQDNLNYGFINYSFMEWTRVATLFQAFYPVEGAHSLQSKFTTINVVYWTLAIEVQFYVVVGLVLAFARRAFYPLMALLTLVSLPFALTDSLLNSGLFIPYWPMFGFGVFLFFLVERGIVLDALASRHTHVLAGGAAAVSLGFLFWGSANGWVLSPTHFAALFACFLWFMKSLDQPLVQIHDRPGYAFLMRPFVALGLMSYSLYLLHGRLQYFTAQVARQIIPENTISLDIVVILVTCLMCWPFYKYCEAPFFQSQGGKERATDQVGAARGDLSVVDQT